MIADIDFIISMGFEFLNDYSVHQWTMGKENEALFSSVLHYSFDCCSGKVTKAAWRLHGIHK